MVQGFAATLEPKHSWLVHISGHEDIGPGFGWDNVTWQREAQDVWRERGLPGQVRMPLIGEVIRLEASQSITMNTDRFDETLTRSG